MKYHEILERCEVTNYFCQEMQRNNITTTAITNGSNFNAVTGNNGQDGLTPHIDENGNWWIGETDTGIRAEGRDGANGLSAYEIAVENGFVGTEQEWLDSLVGEDGTNGIDGIDGLNGEDGKSAYEIAVDNGFEGTEEEWLESIKGEQGSQGTQGEQGIQGERGEQGIQGIQGETGADGKSAYEIWLDEGHTGTEEDFLEWLKGSSGNSAYIVFSSEDNGILSLIKSSTIDRRGFIGTHDSFYYDFGNGELVLPFENLSVSQNHNIPVAIPRDGRIVYFTFYAYCLSVQANVPTSLIAEIWINRRADNDNVFRPHPVNLKFRGTPLLNGGDTRITSSIAVSSTVLLLDLKQGDRIMLGFNLENQENAASMSIYCTATIAISD